jgi:hypothetical protein
VPPTGEEEEEEEEEEDAARGGRGGATRDEARNAPAREPTRRGNETTRRGAGAVAIVQAAADEK